MRQIAPPLSPVDPHLAGCRDALPEGEVADDVDGQQAERQVPLDDAQVGDAAALVNLQHVVPDATPCEVPSYPLHAMKHGQSQLLHWRINNGGLREAHATVLPQ